MKETDIQHTSQDSSHIECQIIFTASSIGTLVLYYKEIYLRSPCVCNILMARKTHTHDADKKKST